MRCPKTTQIRSAAVSAELSALSIVAAAVITGALVIIRTNNHPRTDDAEVFANFIGIAPQVDGPIIELAVAGQPISQTGGVALRDRSTALRIRAGKSEV